jgi:hypothetical protein
MYFRVFGFRADRRTLCYDLEANSYLPLLQRTLAASIALVSVAFPPKLNWKYFASEPPRLIQRSNAPSFPGFK